MNVEAVQYIQDHLGQIPDPDNAGQHLMFVDYQTFPGQFEEQQKLIDENKRRTAHGLGLLLEQGGFTVVRTQDIQGPVMVGTKPLVKVQCSACGSPLLQFTPNQQGIVSVPSSTLAAVNHQCPL